MVTNVKLDYCDHFAIYTDTESLCYIPKTNMSITPQ